MTDSYFRNHYSYINSIDPDSEESFRAWLERSLAGYHRELGPYLPVVAGKKILEIGCGLGGTIHYLQSRGGTDITGVDRSEDQLALCRRYVTQNVITADALDMLQASRVRYDIILALDLIEHLSKQAIIPFLRAVRESLTDGGMLILRTPNMGSLFGLRSRYIDFTHEVGFTEESMQQVLREAGFEVFRVHNAAIGKRRLAAVRMAERFLQWLYNVPRPSVVTANLLVTAHRTTGSAASV